MNHISRFVLVVFLVLLASVGAAAQDSGGDTSDSLRQKIEQLESVDLKSKSATVQDIYKRSLLRLYSQYVSALAQDIADLKKIQTATEGTKPSPQSEVAIQIKRLSGEKGATEEKIKTLNEGDIATTTNNPPKEAKADKPTSDGGTVAQPASNAPAAELSPATKAAFMKATTVSPSELSVTATGSVPPTPVPQPTDLSSPITICGQIKPASLVDIIAVLQSSPELMNKLPTLSNQTKLTNFRESWLGDDCQNPNPNRSGATVTRNSGTQIAAVTEVLRDLLDQLPKLTDNERKALSRHSPSFDHISAETIKREILLLNGYIGNATVILESGANKYSARADKDGNYSVDVKQAGEYTISTEADNFNTRRTVSVNDGGDDTRVDIPIEDRPVSLLTRAIVGYEQAGAAAAKSDQNYFFDLFVSKSFPFAQKIDPDFGERLKTWVDFRFGSVPQTGDVTIGDLTTGTGFATQVKNLKVKDVARVLEFNGGLEYRLSGNTGMLPSFDRVTKQKFSLSLIASGGFTTPTNPLDSISVFKVTPGVPGLPPSSAGKDFVAFVQSDRDKFFRQYYLGLRMQTFFFNLFNMPMQRFPSQLDIAIGQNEFVTRGKLKGPVVRIDGFFPLPYDGLKFINIIGTAMLRPGHSVTGFPLVLQPAPAGTVVPAPNVDLILVPQPNRDYYRVGFGIDLMSLIQKFNQH